MTITKARRVLTGTTKRLAEAVRTTRKEIAAVEAQEELTAAAKTAAIAAARTELREQVDAIEGSAKEAAEAVRAAGPTAPAIDPLEGMRLWQRLQRELDNGGDAVAIARRLAGEGNRTGLQVLSEEIPSFMRASGEGDHVEGVLGEVRQVEQPLLSEEEASHRANVTEVDSALERVAINSGFTRTDAETTDLLIGIADGANVNPQED